METLLKTKLYIPPSPADLVPRPHLISRLNNGLQQKLILISAPAGYGKTTLLSSWIDQSESSFCWISLDENDNDPGRFLAYLIASLKSIDLEIDPEYLKSSQSLDTSQIESILITTINLIADQESRLVAVFDDYHFIQNEEIHEIVTYLLDHMPPRLHLVIATRADPPLPIGRLRARGQMTEIRQTDLRMDLREGNEFFNQVCNLGLSPENIQMLVSRADGWVAGLQMASLALKDRENPSEYIQSFSGSHDYVVDFLTTEVLQGQPESTQKFLMRTSILDRLSAPLCEAVTGEEHSHHILRRLKDENIFLQSLDDQHQWFAYHRLFRDLLTQRLLETGAGEVPNLYLEASQWCEVNGFPNDAIDYAIRGQHIHRAADLVEKQAQTTILQSEIVTFIRWVEQLPEEAISSKPALGIYYAWALFVSNQRTDIANRVLEQVVPTDENQEGHLLAVKSIQAAFQRDIPGAIQQARQALGQLPEDDYFFRQISAWNLSACLFLAGDDKEGAKVLEEVARVSLASGNRMVAIVSLCRLGAIRVQKGDLPKAQASYQQALDVASENRKKPLPAACEAMFGLGKVHWEWFDFEVARKFLLDGIELCKRWREVTSIEGRINLAFLLQSQDDRNGASQSMDTALRVASQDAYTETRVQYVASQQAYLNLRLGKLPAAAEWATQRELKKYLDQEKLESTGQIGADLIRNFELVVFARILIAQKRYAEATQILGWLRPAFEQIEHRVKMIENHILTGAVLESQGKTAQAIASIEQALRLAAPAGYIRIFWDEGPSIIDLVRKVKPHESYAEFTQRVLNVGTAKVVETTKPEKTSDLVEPLSERETEVLGLLQSELSAPEIAAQIHISVSTLRTHIKNIYAKLGVHSRYEAVTKGRDLGLI